MIVKELKPSTLPLYIRINGRVSDAHPSQTQIVQQLMSLGGWIIQRVWIGRGRPCMMKRTPNGTIDN